MLRNLFKKIRHSSWLGIVLVATSLCAGYKIVVWYGWERVLSHHKSTAELGQFADFFGGLMNPIVALCALIGIWYSVNLQKQELAKLSKGQEEQGRQQRFFDLLRLYQQALDSIVVIDVVHNHGSVLTSGKSAMNLFMNAEATRFKFTKAAKNHGFDNANRDQLVKNEWMQEGEWMGHYFRVVFMFLDDAEVNFGEDHEKYVKLFCAQLSRDEIRFLALYMMFDINGKSVQKFAAKYGLLHNLPSDQIKSYAELQMPDLFPFKGRPHR
jgi:hypothetical protein